MRNTSQGRQFEYIKRTYGNNALDIKRALDEKPTGEPLRVHKSKQELEDKTRISFLHVLTLAVCSFLIGMSLFNYIKTQADITNSVDNIAVYEQSLNNLTLANDDEYSKMINAIDYDEIRRVAVEELHMVYASEDQIITYTRENSDYVRQLSDLEN